MDYGKIAAPEGFPLGDDRERIGALQCLFCTFAQLKIGTIASLIEYRSRHESLVSRSFERDIDTAWGRLRLVAFHDLPTRASCTGQGISVV